ncbi:putative hydrolase Mb2248c-like protein 2 [Colletotrichum chlorophyti]|uniref:Putative hydrolase Mb2248c-like protein 2 n=1 Tax=Colletotrichum chlorophyti TaxID=708187 RepID=A0A1Q8RAL2_9PEZI|nr:putative hydrolase Mb2248c-like protein 2 [Colletotrichum chlorophyti]
MSAKSFAESHNPPRPLSLKRAWARPLVFAVLLFLICTWKLHGWFYDRNALLHSDRHPFPVYTDWDDIPTNEKLRWARCALPGMIPGGPGYLCARFTVPMDYQRPLNQSADNPKVHIALVLLPAPGHGLETGRFSESPLLINPGGPGGSGTSFMFPPIGPAIQAAAGGTMDLIGFDPRGIGNTVPRADCFVDAEPDQEPSAEARHLAAMNRLTWLSMAHDIGLPNTTASALGQIAQRAEAVSRLCLEKDGDAGGFRYMGTPNVAADLKSIVDAHDAWLEDNGLATVPLDNGRSSPNGAPPPSTKGKLVYWGFSYGTLLGQTFAAMYPDSVGRLLLDGVVDSSTYDAPAWISSMRDADAVLEKFFYYCYLAEDKCDLFRSGDDGPEPIRQRYDKVMAKLRAEPLIVIAAQGHMPVVLMESDLKRTLFVSLYSPIVTFPTVASLLNRLYTGADLSLWILVPNLGSFCDSKITLYDSLLESQPAIGCSDQRYKRNESLEEVFDKVSGYTKNFADIWMSLMIACEGWGIEAQFPRPDWDANLHKSEPINTSFPILFAGNTHDPVTPVSSAVLMSRKFVNASLFELEAEGHVTLAAVSLCALRKIQDYLQRGILPPKPTVTSDGHLTGWEKCKSDERPWKPFSGGSEATTDDNAGMRAEDLRVLQALKDVHARVVSRLTPPLKLRLHHG